MAKGKDKSIATVKKPKMKPRGGNSPVIGTNGMLTAPGDNSKFILFGLHLSNLPPVDINTPEDVNDRINEYFQLCADADLKPAVSGLAMALNLDRRRLWEIAKDKPSEHAKVRNLPVGTRDCIKKAYMSLDILWENYMQNNKIHPTAGIFLGINNHGYHDVKQLTLTPGIENPLGDIKDPEEIRQRYLDALPEAEE